MAEKTKTKKNIEKEIASAISARGRSFEGIVTKRFEKRIVVETERTVYIPKYERYHKKKIRLHARIPTDSKVSVGDRVKIKECRPLSKIIHFVLTTIVKSVEKEEVK
jgi:small subunit ribosomal protein S17